MIAKGFLQLEQNKYKEAADIFKSALKVDPKRPEALFNMGLAYTYGSMKTEAINTWKNFLKDFNDEHLEYYKSAIVESVVEGIKNGVRTNSIVGIPKRISFVINQKINEVILDREWSKSQKLQMVDLLNDFKKEIKYTQPL